LESKLSRASKINLNPGLSDRLSFVINVLADGSYTGEPFAEAVKEAIDASVEIAKRSELHTFKVIPKRWVVERSFGWLDKYRRLWKNCERQINTSLQMVVFAFIAVLLRRTEFGTGLPHSELNLRSFNNSIFYYNQYIITFFYSKKISNRLLIVFNSACISSFSHCNAWIWLSYWWIS
jgi:transposase